MKTFFVYATFLLLLQSCHKDGTCELPTRARYKDFEFQFPLKAFELMQRPEKKTYLRGTYVLFDSLRGSPMIYCYMEHAQNRCESSDSINFLKDANIYGISYRMFSEYRKSDEEFLRELKELYPGDYVRIFVFNDYYYLNHQECMSVIFKRESFENMEVPVVSFVYGLDKQTEQYYAAQTGTNTFPD